MKIEIIKDLLKKCIIAGYDLDIIDAEQLDELWNKVGEIE